MRWLAIGLAMVGLAGCRSEPTANALYRAAYDGDVKEVRRILKAGTDPAAMVSSGFEPLHAAAMNGRHEVAKILLEAGAPINDRCNDRNFTPLCYAAYTGDAKIADLLLRNGARVDIRSGDDGYTPLHWAAERGNTDVIPILLRHGAKVNERTRSGRTSMVLAYNLGREDIVEMLRSAGGRWR